jgi:N-acetylmuramoyl-L-alanine amidase
MRNSLRARRTLLRLMASGVIAGLTEHSILAQAPARAQQSRRLKRAANHLPMIVIDPGHGGIDPGAIGAGDVYEKNITFAVATGLVHLLHATGRYRVALTRRADEYMPLRERVSRARALRADLFLSLHADVLPSVAMRGLSVFTLSATASDREAAALADSENRDVAMGVRLSHQQREVGAILVDLARRETENLSLAFAHDLVVSLGREVRLLENPQRSAGFVVLTAPDIPAALVELGCLSNPIEERLLQRSSYQRRLARGLARAIEAFFQTEAMS